MDLTLTYLNTFIPELPKIINNNFQSVKRYIDVFYDGSLGVILAPIQTTGNIKGAKGEFVTAVIDNLIVKSQYTNLYENVTTADYDYYKTFIGVDTSTRDASTTLFENTDFKYVDVNKPYYKISNDASLAFRTTNLSQQIQLIFDVSTSSASQFTIMLDPSKDSGVEIMSVTVVDASKFWAQLICTDYDASWGSTWTIKQYGGTYTSSII